MKRMGTMRVSILGEEIHTKSTADESGVDDAKEDVFPSHFEALSDPPVLLRHGGLGTDPVERKATSFPGQGSIAIERLHREWEVGVVTKCKATQFYTRSGDTPKS